MNSPINILIITCIKETTHTVRNERNKSGYTKGTYLSYFQHLKQEGQYSFSATEKCKFSTPV